MIIQQNLQTISEDDFRSPIVENGKLNNLQINWLEYSGIKMKLAKAILDIIAPNDNNALLADIGFNKENNCMEIVTPMYKDKFIIPLDVLEGKERGIIKIAVGKEVKEEDPFSKKLPQSPVVWEEKTSYNFRPKKDFWETLDYIFAVIFRAELSRYVYAGIVPNEVISNVQKIIKETLEALANPDTPEA